MKKTTFDVKLLALIERGKQRLDSFEPEHATGLQAKIIAVELLDDVLGTYRQKVEELVEEGEEAARAAEEVAEAEGDVEETYEQLSAVCTSRYYELQADPDADHALYKRRMDRGFPYSPSDFAKLGVDRSAAVMETAVEFARGTLPAGNPVLERATEALTALRDKLATADGEEADRVEVMQALFATRTEAKGAYVAARKIVDAVLSLDGKQDGLSQLLPPVRTIYRSGSTASEPEITEDVVEPVEA